MFKGHTFSKLKKNGVKGDNGCIIVIGGSEMYTGAPIFAALGALRSGADLVYILTTKKAIGAIKQLREAIVLPLELNTRICNRATACIVGPGMGRPEKKIFDKILQIIKYIDSRNVPFILDADAIHFYKTGEFQHLKNVVLTPNHNEAKGLKVLDQHICIYKGEIDIISHRSISISVGIPSSSKRCGGQGDILSGMLATAFSLNRDDPMDACVSSCEFLRTVTHAAFQRMGFSLITSDIFDEIGTILFEILRDV